MTPDDAIQPIKVSLTRGAHAVVDESDKILVESISWVLAPGPHTNYAQASVKSINGRFVTVKMHRVIVRALPWEIVDHINGDGLDNRRCNLRVCTRRQNRANASRHVERFSSAYRGVSRTPEGTWLARHTENGRRFIVGTFATERDAARAYDIESVRIHGPFARLNLPGETFTPNPTNGSKARRNAS